MGGATSTTWAGFRLHLGGVLLISVAFFCFFSFIKWPPTVLPSTRVTRLKTRTLLFGANSCNKSRLAATLSFCILGEVLLNCHDSCISWAWRAHFKLAGNVRWRDRRSKPTQYYTARRLVFNGSWKMINDVLMPTISVQHLLFCIDSAIQRRITPLPPPP